MGKPEENQGKNKKRTQTSSPRSNQTTESTPKHQQNQKSQRVRLNSELQAFKQQQEYTNFLNKPHTITALFIVLIILVYISNVLQPELDGELSSEIRAKRGVFGVITVFLVYSVLQGPSTKLVRPHPAVWKLVYGVFVVYFLFLTFLLFQSNLDPSLGVELPERSYGGDCRLFKKGEGVNWEILKDTVWDEFVIAHTLGWWGKALIMRNQFMLWSVSILFELMEQTFQHMLPNFNECWWDSWLLDVAICNVIGIYTGMATVRHFRSHTYDWRGMSHPRGVVAKAKRSILQFTPKSVEYYQWSIFSSPKRCLQCLVLIVAALTVEVNAFFLKFVLWVPPTCLLNSYRLIIFFLMAIPATHEYYEFIQRRDTSMNEAVRKLGSYAWLALAVILMELLAIFKFSKGLFLEPWPKHVVIVWGVAGISFVVTMAVWQYQLVNKKRQNYKSK